MIVNLFDEAKVNNIAKNCGDESVKKSIAYLRRAKFNNPQSFVCEIIDDYAFFAGSICKSHFRLYEIAVLQEKQNCHYGSLCMLRIFKICNKYHLNRITLRVNKNNQRALKFYNKYNATIIADKNIDWEVEIKV